MPKSSDLVGVVSGRLTVIKKSHNSSNGWLWLCNCACGNNSYVLQYGILSKKIKSCGCLQREKARKTCENRNTTHGKSKTRTYTVWAGMIARCLNKKSTAYYRYGGRGISVSNKWMDFSAFLEDMGECPVGLSIDRIDNSLGYCKENCRWTDGKTQARNKRSNLIVQYFGKKIPLSEIAEESGCNYKSLWHFVRVRKLNISDAIIAATKTKVE